MIIAAIPAFNEENAIAGVVFKAKKYVDEVFVIDDGSWDNTSEIAELVGAKVVKHKKNVGYGKAIKSCFETAKKVDADVLVILDGDGQHNPDEIPLLTSPVLDGEADVVLGSRFIEETDTIPSYRRVGMNILTAATNVGLKSSISDSQSGFRAYSKKAIEQLKFSEAGMGVGSEILVASGELGLKIKEVPITVKYGGLDVSTYNPLIHGLSVFKLILSLIKEKRPLLFFGSPGLLFLIAGIALGLWTIDVYSNTDFFPVGKAMLSVLFTVVGILSIFTALILDSITTIIKRTE